MTGDDRMTGDEMRAELETMRWSVRGFAELVQVRQTTAARWASDVHPIPPPVARWLRQAAKWMRAHPPPTVPKRGAAPDDPAGGS
jgi:hypothetical protein